MAEIVPFFNDPTIMPGDTLKINLNILLRLLTPIVPTMDDLFADIYFFFVPNRLIWNHWKEYMGENKTGTWTQQVEYEKPKLRRSCYLPSENERKAWRGTVWDYMYGGNIAKSTSQGYEYVDSLPLRAYVLTYNEWFRDQNWIAPAYEQTNDGTSYAEVNNTALGGKPFKIAKYHDLFTSALPAPQKGTAISIPYGNGIIEAKDPTKWPTFTSNNIVQGSGDGALVSLSSQAQGNVLWNAQDSTGATQLTALKWNDPNLKYTLEAPSINAMREAFAYQRILERLARGGSRYIEIIKSFWGVTAGDARLQRPEYLGGKSIPISMAQVPQTSGTTATSPLGTLSAFSQTFDSDRMFTKSFTEHGVLLGLIAVRQKHSYQQGIERIYTQFKKYENYWPQLAHLGEQGIKMKEIYSTGDPANDDTIIGFNEAFYQYRFRQDRISGLMRSGFNDSLDIWHYADYYNNAPVIGQTFIEETDTYLRRTLAVTDNTTHQFYMASQIKGTITRAMPLYGIPGLIDHL